jgi:hypothetical protein
MLPPALPPALLPSAPPGVLASNADLADEPLRESVR